MSKAALRGAFLSSQQERLWGFMQDNHVYRVQGYVALKGNLDEQAFQYALRSLVKRHEILRTVFHYLPGMDTPVQVIGRDQQIDCPTISLEALRPVEQDTLLTGHFTTLQMQPFDLIHGPLLQTMLFRLSNDAHILLVALSALCADASTLSLLVTELGCTYNASFQVLDDINNTLQYSAVMSWQKKLLASEGAKIPQEYWSRIDCSQHMQMHLPFELPEIAALPMNSNFVPHLTSLPLNDDLSRQIHTIVNYYNVSVPAVLLTCWYIALFRLTGEPDQLVGVAGDGRIYEEFLDIPGLYTRFVPVDICLDKHNTFAQLLKTIHLSLQEAMKWQLYFTWPASDNAEHSRECRNSYAVLFEYENWPAVVASEGLTLELSQRFCCTEPFRLKLSALQVGTHLQLDFFYDSQCISADYVPQLCSVVYNLLQDVVTQPEIPINTLRILPQHEQKRLIMAFRGATQSGISYSLTQLFEVQVVRTPNLLAVVGMTEELTYQEVNCRANQLARVLRSHSVGPNVVVGLRVTRSARMLVGMLAILKAGGAYMPLDSEIPRARLEHQLYEARVSLLLTQHSMLNDLPTWNGEILCIDVIQDEVMQERDTNLPSLCEPGDLAYVIYTSGSTGVPKGILIQQQSVVNYALALCDLLGCEPGWQFATVSTLAADLGNTAIFCALLSGGGVQVLDYETVTSGAAFSKWSAGHPIDVLKIVPSHLAALLADEEQIHNILPRRALIMGGEVLPVELVLQLQERAGNCKIYNHYGPTETTIGVLVNDLQVPHVRMQIGEISGTRGGIFPGRPIANMEVYVLDGLLRVVPVGVTGELYVGGLGVALGYLQRPEQTAACFVPHPFSEEPGRRLYRTGDLVKYTLQNQIAFVGRRDHQVKLRGNRIELSEIESVLQRHPQIRDAVVLLHEDGPGGPYIVAYVVMRQQPELSSNVLQSYLCEYLPVYMIPSAFVYLKTLPLTANGKVDRQRLLSTSIIGHEHRSSMDTSDNVAKKLILPRDMIELQLLQIWEKLLQRRPISVTDNFFDLGGHSILAVRLIAHILQQFGRDLPLSAIFMSPTIASMATTLRQQDNVKNQSTLAALQTQGSNPPFFCVHPSGNIAFKFLHLARYLAPDQPLYGLQSIGFTIVEDEISSIEDLAACYIAAMQTVQPQGPYFLGGWSMGGVVALEMAQQLLQQGHEIGLLAIIDSRLADAHQRTRAMEMDPHLSDAELVRLMVSQLGLELPAGFHDSKVEDQVNTVFELAREKNEIPEDFELERARYMYQTEKKHTRLARIYAPQRYPQRIDYFACSASLNLSQEAEDANTSQGAEDTKGVVRTHERPKHLNLWDEVATGGLTVHVIPGNHTNMLEEPNVQVLATSLKQCVDGACL